MHAYFSFDHSRWGQIISGNQSSGSNSVTDSSLLTSLHRVWSRQVYIIHRSITGFLVVQEATCTHAHEYRLLGPSCFLQEWRFPSIQETGPGWVPVEVVRTHFVVHIHVCTC